MNEPIVEATGVRRTYGARVALADLDFRLESGRILGLLGPNGSGKTTLLKLLAGLLKPTAGKVRVLGSDPYADRASVMRNARFAFAPPALYEYLTARETLEGLTALGWPRSQRPGSDVIDQALAQVGLTDRADDRIRSYSLGMRQRLTLAQALVPIPRLLVLDEPTDGLDPIGSRELRQLLAGLRDSGVAVILASHNLAEIEELADELLMLHEGSAVYHGGPKALLESTRRLRLRIDGDAQAVNKAIEAFSRRDLHAEQNGRGELILPSGSLSLDQAIEFLKAEGIVLGEFHESPIGLEEALLSRIPSSVRDRTVKNRDMR